MWIKIEHLNEHIKGREMFVVRAFDVIPHEGAMLYTTDPYCTWLDEMLGMWVFPRWPHAFKPTHFCLLPDGREA